MARPESLWEADYICMKVLAVSHNIHNFCKCPKCTDRGKKRPLKKDIEFPELIQGACRKELDEKEGSNVR